MTLTQHESFRKLFSIRWLMEELNHLLTAFFVNVSGKITQNVVRRETFNLRHIDPYDHSLRA